MVALFLNGEGMRGGAVHHTVESFPFLGEVRTAARYRFYSVREEFPGLAPAAAGEGAAISGELYDVPLSTVGETFLAAEPAELELGVVALSDGSYALCVQLRPGEVESGRHRDITEYGGWRAYRSAPAQ
ncbi:MAG TPA: gamma-glutamylcyclotransferase [Nocardioidaceae bacterium]|nr:gamma-glutamylcyclotransferase [Nocardioidaceae bacterium]